MVSLYYTARSANRKTGDIPQQWIGGSIEETRQTCVGCPLLDPAPRNPDGGSFRIRHFGLRCYAHGGFVRMAHKSVLKHAAANPERYSLYAALSGRVVSARFARFAAIGDPSAIDPATYAAHEALCRAAGLGVISYTHFGDAHGKWLKGQALYSADTWEEAIYAVNSGWRAAVHLPIVTQPRGTTPEGIDWIRCPFELGRATCNDCGLCDATRQTRFQLIVFQEA